MGKCNLTESAILLRSSPLHFLNKKMSRFKETKYLTFMLARPRFGLTVPDLSAGRAYGSPQENRSLLRSFYRFPVDLSVLFLSCLNLSVCVDGHRLNPTYGLTILGRSVQSCETHHLKWMLFHVLCFYLTLIRWWILLRLTPTFFDYRVITFVCAF